MVAGRQGFLEDINNLLNSGEVPGLFQPDEKERLISDIRPFCQKMGVPETKDSMWAAFINRARAMLPPRSSPHPPRPGRPQQQPILLQSAPHARLVHTSRKQTQAGTHARRSVALRNAAPHASKLLITIGTLYFVSNII